MNSDNSAGIYSIVDKLGRMYIGSSQSMRQRWYGHRFDLSRGTHSNKKLQNCWNKYGEHFFVFKVLLICSDDNLLVYEQIFLDFFNPHYNICKVAGNTRGVVGRGHWNKITHPEAAATISAKTKGREQAQHVKDAVGRANARRKGIKHPESRCNNIRAGVAAYWERRRQLGLPLKHPRRVLEHAR